MIFITVGSQLPFDRLVITIDNWATNHKEQTIFAQIGHSDYHPKNFKFCQIIKPIDYHKRITEADIIIAHAGIGTIITALESEKKLLLMPRLANQGEHRNNHQLATIKSFSKFPTIKIATDEHFLPLILNQMLKDKTIPLSKINPHISAKLIAVIRNFSLT